MLFTLYIYFFESQGLPVSRYRISGVNLYVCWGGLALINSHQSQEYQEALQNALGLTSLLYQE